MTTIDAVPEDLESAVLPHERIPSSPPASPRDGRGWLVRMTRGAVAGLVGAAAVVLARRLGLLDGIVGLVFAALVLVALPVSRSLSRRLVITGSAVLGWVPVVWWVPLPVGSWGRVTIGLAVVLAGLAFWTATAPAPAVQVRRLVPRFALVDALPFGAAAVVAIIAGRWALGGTGASALAVLSRGWDHSSHFYMTTTIRRTGTVLAHLGAGPGGDEWVYRHYPQGFHAVAATIMELLGGPAVVDGEHELVAYVHAIAIVAVVCVLLVVAGVAALPGLANRRWIALPLAVFVATVLVLGPGGSALPDGFPNFVLASSLLALVPVLTILLVRIHTPAVLLALGGVAVGIAHGWILLLALAAPAIVAMGAPWSRARWRGDRRQWVVTGAIGLATVIGVGYGVALVSSESLGEVLVAVGGIEAPPASTLVFLTGAAVAASIAAWTVVPRRGGRRPGVITRAGLLGIVPLAGAVVAAAIGVVQLRSTGELSLHAVTGHLSYYFFKFAIGLVIISTMVLVTAIGVAAPYVTAPRSSRLRLLASACLAVVITQAFGLTVPQLVDAGMGSPAPALPRQQDWAVASRTHLPEVDALLAAVDHHRPASGHVVFVTGPNEKGLHPVSAAQWYFALTGTWTTEANTTASVLVQSHETALAARDVLASDAAAVVVVSPADPARVLEEVADEGWTGRVLSY